MRTNYIVSCLLVLIIGAGCSKKDKDYEKLLAGGEIVYPGVVSNITFRPGNERVQLVWNPSPDPSVTQYVIYWNNRQDSLKVDAVSHLPSDTIRVLISNLNEYVYGFSIFTLDANGRASIPQQLNNVKVYGPVYRGGLLNRPYNASNPYSVDANGALTLNFNVPDTINIATQIRYTNTSNVVKDTLLLPGNNSIVLKDFQFGTTLQYRSSYIPVMHALDTFHVQAFSNFPTIKRIGDVTTTYIKNPGNPFLRGDNGNGKWGTLKDWLFNSNVLNQNGNTAGGWSWDGNPSGVIHLESQDWGGPGLTNGKIYQTFTLPAGEYEASFNSDGGGGSFINGNFLAVAGSTLPDIDQLGNVLGLVHWDQNNPGGNHAFTFTLAQPTQIALGWVVSTGSYTWNHINRITLKQTN